MGAIIALTALIIGGSFGAANHDGVFKKGYDTTYIDTVAFEKRQAEFVQEFQQEKIARLNQKEAAYQEAHPEAQIQETIHQEKNQNGNYF